MNGERRPARRRGEQAVPGERPRRDRDANGRPRNARPRDGLGRPLPYGALGTARQPEGVRRSAPRTLAEAQRLLDAGMPFHAHEVFEDAWKTGAAPDRDLWRGLAQLAVGLTHAARGKPRGAVALLRRGEAAVAAYGEQPPYGIDAAALAEWARRSADALEYGAEDGAAAGGALPPMPRLCGGGRRSADPSGS